MAKELTLSSVIQTKSFPACLILFQHVGSLWTIPPELASSPPPPLDHGFTLPTSHHNGFAAKPVNEIPLEDDDGAGSMGV